MEKKASKILEEDPSGRFVKLKGVLGKGAFKTVHRGFDREEGVEIAWNIVRCSSLDTKQMERLKQEISILESLDHPFIMRLISVWEAPSTRDIIMCTELLTSGTLKDYMKKAGHIPLNVVKKWNKQILSGLNYLHNEYSPPIIHRDLKSDNIFINGGTGNLKIGDLGLSVVL